METRKRFLTVIVMVLSYWFAGNIMAQEVSVLPIDPSNPEFRAKFDKLEFNDRFAVLAASDESNHYFLADFSKFQTRFEKIWFLNLVFQDAIIVTIDSAIELDRFWFLSKRIYSEEQVLDEMDALKTSTFKRSEEMTEDEKAEWMGIHDKYK